ncbi:hypothetical protein D3C72_783500 [compost metagenome]
MHVQAAAGRFAANGHRLLAGTGVFELGFQLADLVAQLVDAAVHRLLLAIERLGKLALLVLLDEGGTGQILAPLGQGQLGLGLPFVHPLLMAADLTADLFLVGEEAGQVGALLHQFIFHLLDDQAHHLLGILGLVEQGRQIGIDDVGQAGKNTHGCTPVMGIGLFLH